MTSASAAQSNGGPYQRLQRHLLRQLHLLARRRRPHPDARVRPRVEPLQRVHRPAGPGARGVPEGARARRRRARRTPPTSGRPREMIAEDYRQLFGSANARSGGQINTQIPLASDVPGLRDYLADAFTTRPRRRRRPDADTRSRHPSRRPSRRPSPTPEPTPAPRADGARDEPEPGEDDGRRVRSRSSAPASATVRIFTAKGALVRSLLADAAKPAGAVSLVWDRKDAAGRRVGKGTYRAPGRRRRRRSGNAATANDARSRWPETDSGAGVVPAPDAPPVLVSGQWPGPRSTARSRSRGR